MVESVGVDRVESLIAERKSLKSSLKKSKAIGLALGKIGPRFDETEQRLSSLETAVRPIRADREALVVVGGPASTVLKVFDDVHGIEKSLLSDPKKDLSGYLAVLKRLDEALKFLGDNCGLAIQWLEDIVEYLEDHSVAEDKYLSNLKKSLRGLREFQNEGRVEKEKASLDGGLRDAALDKLENEF